MKLYRLVVTLENGTIEHFYRNKPYNRKAIRRFIKDGAYQVRCEVCEINPEWKLEFEGQFPRLVKPEQQLCSEKNLLNSTVCALGGNV